MFNLNYAGLHQAWWRFAQADQGELLAGLGYEADVSASACLLDNGAVIASLAFLAQGIPVAGSRRIETGPLTGGKVFTGANAMADWLANCFMPPETISIDRGLGDVTDRLFGRRGIAAFISGSGPQGGQIGLSDGSNGHLLCTGAQQKYPLEVRFWVLN